MELTAVFVKVPEGYVAFIEELPGANTQGVTLDEARDNLREAVELVVEANRTLAQEFPEVRQSSEKRSEQSAVKVDPISGTGYETPKLRPYVDSTSSRRYFGVS